MRTNSEIQLEIDQLKSKNQTEVIQRAAINIIGGVAGVVYAKNQEKGTLGQIGFFLLGSILSGVASNLVYPNRIGENNAQIKYLETQLTN